jgi:hypothetical protein
MSTLSVTSDVSELTNLTAEIKRQTLALKDLRKRAAECKKRICEYMKSKDQPGVKFRDQALVLEEKTTRATKKKADKVADTIKILRANGIADPSKVLNELEEARKGQVKKVASLSVKTIRS